jgi:hypothetical protein
MKAPVELSALSGLDQIRAIFAGKTGYEGIVKTLNLNPVSAEEGFVVFEGSPTRAVYKPLGVVMAATPRPCSTRSWAAPCIAA